MDERQFLTPDNHTQPRTAAGARSNSHLPDRLDIRLVDLDGRTTHVAFARPVSAGNAWGEHPGLMVRWSNETRLSTLRVYLTWVAVGILFAFTILAVLSVGFLFAPVAILLASAAILSDHRQGRNLLTHLGIWLVVVMVIASLMLVIIRLL